MSDKQLICFKFGHHKPSQRVREHSVQTTAAGGEMDGCSHPSVATGTWPRGVVGEQGHVLPDIAEDDPVILCATLNVASDGEEEIEDNSRLWSFRSNSECQTPGCLIKWSLAFRHS